MTFAASVHISFVYTELPSAKSANADTLCEPAYCNKNIDIFKEDLIMAFVIGDACISCGACAGQCPVGAIAEGDGKFEIDADKCISCGSCAGGCPVGAISEE